MWQQAIQSIDAKMKKSVDVAREELSKIRTGRANPHLLDAIRVDYYGTPTALKQLAAVTAPEPRLLIIQPFDAGIVGEIHKTIAASDMGLQPQIDGRMIRIPIPALSKERREDLAKIVKKVAEDGRVSVRAVRRDGNEDIKKLEKDKKLTEDDRKKALDEIQKITDRHTKALDDLADAKEKEVLTA